MLAAVRLGNRKNTTSTSDTRREVPIKLNEIIHLSPETLAAAFKPTITVAKNSERREN
jgi:hypothetical protein